MAFRKQTRESKNVVLVRLSLDYEHPSRTWWENGGQELWDSIRESFEEGAVILDENVAASWLRNAEQVAGWNDGPDYAPHPIRLTPLAEDEIE